tara:strand:- start:22312 stop:23094 length:783 start_codon:yes stop_codon:yes gene_type:complete
MTRRKKNATGAEPQVEDPNAAPIEGGVVALQDDPEGQDPEAQDPEAADAEGEGDSDADDSADDLSSADDEVLAKEARSGPGPGEDLDDDELIRRLAALLFASPDPLSEGKLVALLERPRRARVTEALNTLGARLEAAGLPLQVRGLRGGWMLMSTPEMGNVLSRLAKGNPIERVSAAALETLSIVAYRQPVTKAEIESIRGVQAGPILRSLVDRGLVRVTGRADVPGHPLQYGTTPDFLDRFGLQGLEQLPRDNELARDE